jgi:hypothetical protein
MNLAKLIAEVKVSRHFMREEGGLQNRASLRVYDTATIDLATARSPFRTRPAGSSQRVFAFLDGNSRLLRSLPKALIFWESTRFC